MDDGLVCPVDEDTPQGGPLSPILSNLVLDDLDEPTRSPLLPLRQQLQHVRSRRAGERVMASVGRFLTKAAAEGQRGEKRGSAAGEA